MEIIPCGSPYQFAIIRTEPMSAMEQFLEGPLLAGSVKSPTTASEHPKSKDRGFADRLLWRNLDGRNGHGVLIR